MADHVPFYKTKRFAGIVSLTLIVGIPVICVAVGAAFLPKGTERTGKLVAKDGKWVIEYKEDNTVKSTPLFTSEELNNITLWVTEKDPSPTGERGSSMWLGLLVCGVIALVVEIVALIVFLVLRAKKQKKAKVAAIAPAANASYYTY